MLKTLVSILFTKIISTSDDYKEKENKALSNNKFTINEENDESIEYLVSKPKNDFE